LAAAKRQKLRNKNFGFNKPWASISFAHKKILASITTQFIEAKIFVSLPLRKYLIEAKNFFVRY